MSLNTNGISIETHSHYPFARYKSGIEICQRRNLQQNQLRFAGYGGHNFLMLEFC
jgi:hypothetical protein